MAQSRASASPTYHTRLAGYSRYSFHLHTLPFGVVGDVLHPPHWLRAVRANPQTAGEKRGEPRARLKESWPLHTASASGKPGDDRRMCLSSVSSQVPRLQYPAVPMADKIGGTCFWRRCQLNAQLRRARGRHPSLSASPITNLTNSPTDSYRRRLVRGESRLARGLLSIVGLGRQSCACSTRRTIARTFS